MNAFQLFSNTTSSSNNVNSKRPAVLVSGMQEMSMRWLRFWNQCVETLRHDLQHPSVLMKKMLVTAFIFLFAFSPLAPLVNVWAEETAAENAAAIAAEPLTIPTEPVSNTENSVTDSGSGSSGTEPATPTADVSPTVNTNPDSTTPTEDNSTTPANTDNTNTTTSETDRKSVV